MPSRKHKAMMSSEANVNQVACAGKVATEPEKTSPDDKGQWRCLRFYIENAYKPRSGAGGTRHICVCVPRDVLKGCKSKVRLGDEVVVEGVISTSFDDRGAKSTFLYATGVTSGGCGCAPVNEVMLSGKITGKVRVRRTKQRLSVARFTLQTENGPVDVQVSGGDVLEQAIALSDSVYAVVLGRLHTYRSRADAWVMEVAASKVRAS